MFFTIRDNEAKCEEVVACVLLIENRQALLGCCLRKVTLEINKLWLNRSCLGIYNLLEEVTLLVVVGWDWSDSRLLNLLNSGVVTLLLIDACEVVTEELIGKTHNLCLGQLRYTSEFINFLLP